MTIRLASVTDVREFVSLATTQPYSVLVADGDRFVNATSFMCLFSLDYAQPLTVEMDCSKEEWEAFAPKLRKFAVQQLA